MDLTTYPFNQTLSKAQLKQLEKQKALWKYYEGDFKKWLIPKILPNGSVIDDNVRVSLSRKVVNKGNYFLFGKGLEWQLFQNKETSLEELTANKTKENVLASIWGNQETQTAFLSELGINGGVTGVFHIQIVAKEGQPLALKNLDPNWVFVTPDKEDNDKPLAYDLRWFEDEDLYRILHVNNKPSANWTYTKQQWKVHEWITVEPETIWPFDWPFIISGKNLPNPNNFFGLSDLEDADINDSINLVASNLNRIIRIFANPIVWGYGFGANSLNVDTSKVLTATSDKAQLAALELARDLSSPQEYLKFLRSIYSEVTNVPESDPERLKIGASSGFALEVLFNDLLLKTGIKRAFYGKALIELNRRLLELSGFGPDNVTTLHWQNPLPVDKTSETTSDTFDLNAQLVSKRTLSTKRGYDYDTELEHMKEEQSNNTALGENILAAFRNGQG